MNKKDDLDILARTIWGEARGEGQKGMEAVACVIMNRVKANKWFTGYLLIDHNRVSSVAETCLKPYQFSCWNENDVNLEKLKRVGTEDPFFSLALNIANQALSGRMKDFTHGATHYKVRTCKASWIDRNNPQIPCYELGKHVFYNNIN